MSPVSSFKGLIEFSSGFTPRPGISHVLFDFDGTLSLIREGWAEVMIAMFLEMLPRRNASWIARVFARTSTSTNPNSAKSLPRAVNFVVSWNWISRSPTSLAAANAAPTPSISRNTAVAPNARLSLRIEIAAGLRMVEVTVAR